MRSGWWILSVCVLVGVTLAAAASDDSPFNELRTNSSEKPGSSYFSRFGSGEDSGLSPTGARYTRQRRSAPPAQPAPAATAKPTPKPGVKNVYAELFEEADKAAAQPSEADRKARQEALYRELMKAREAAPAAGTAPRQPVAPTATAPAAPAAQTIIPASAEQTPTADDDSQVINAGFDDEHPKENMIEQIRATSRGATIRRSPLPTRPAPTATARPAAAEVTTAPRPAQIKVDPSLVGPQSPSVEVRWVAKTDVNVGQECVCQLIVKNTGRIAARKMIVDAHLPASARIVKATPAPTESGAWLSWQVEALNAGEEQVFDITIIPSQRGELAAAADVRFTGSSAAIFAVQEPLLKLAIKGPTEVLIGDPASHLVTVSNPGTGMAHDVTIEATVPEGLEHSNGRRLAMGIGSLGPGESRSVRLALAAVAGGEQMLLVEAKSSSNLRQIAEAKINVVAPSLDLKAEGPSLRYINRNATYTFTVSNNSNTATNNVRVIDLIPSGFAFVKASKGGQLDASGKTVNWFVGRLEPGQSTKLELELAAREMGQFVHQIRAVGDNGAQAVAATETRIDGTASLVLEVADLDDPVEVGAETAYEIRVRNEGSKAASKLSVACELPAGVELIAAKSSEHTVSNGMVVFTARGDLAPRQTLTYRIYVKGSAAGNLRFRANLTSDSLQKPVTVEEVTKFYAD